MEFLVHKSFSLWRRNPVRLYLLGFQGFSAIIPAECRIIKESEPGLVSCPKRYLSVMVNECNQYFLM